jgi:hypothetical protein
MRIRTVVSLALTALVITCLPGLAAASLQCTESDRSGNRSVAVVKTGAGGTIESFHWEMHTPKGASCEFDSADFSFAPRGPSTEFQSNRSACRLLIWSQGQGVTMAPSSCEAHCTGPEAHDYLWPIVFDRSGRGCGREK